MLIPGVVVVGLHVDDGVVEVGADVAGGVQGPGQPQVVISLGHLPDNTCHTYTGHDDWDHRHTLETSPRSSRAPSGNPVCS